MNMLGKLILRHGRRLFTAERAWHQPGSLSRVDSWKWITNHQSERDYSSKPVVKDSKIDVVNEEKNEAEPVLEVVKDVTEWQEDQDSPMERAVKRKSSLYRTHYSKAMEEEAPEDEEGLLQYYVKKAQDSMEETDDAEYYDIIEPDKRLFFRMVDLWIQDAGEARRGHREFLQVAMNNVERFNVQYDPAAYLKILECYPQSAHTGMRRPKWFKAVWQDKIIDHELGVRLFGVMQKYRAPANDEFFNTCMRLFGPYSRATVTVRQMIFWGPRLMGFDPFPVAEKDIAAMDSIEIAFRGLRQANPTLDAFYNRFEVDKSGLEEDEGSLADTNLDCIISVQTEKQRDLLQAHDVSQPIYVEGPHMMYFRKHKIQYYVMRADPLAAKIAPSRTTILTDKEWWTQFYKKDIKTMKRLGDSGEIYSDESFLPRVEIGEGLSFSELIESRNEICRISSETEAVEGKVYAVAATDYRSPNALKSWLKGLQPNNPVLTQLTVVFNKKESFLSVGYKSKPNEAEDT